MKIFKNYIETFENIRKYSNFFYLYAHLIEIPANCGLHGLY
jgi:hypothetical protein